VATWVRSPSTRTESQIRVDSNKVAVVPIKCISIMEINRVEVPDWVVTQAVEVKEAIACRVVEAITQIKLTTRIIHSRTSIRMSTRTR